MTLFGSSRTFSLPCKRAFPRSTLLDKTLPTCSPSMLRQGCSCTCSTASPRTPSPFTIFLDDFGIIRSREVLDIVRQFLRFLPPGKRVVIAIRGTPELGLGRIRAQGELVEIDLKDLRFTHDEAEQFIRQTQGLDLDDRDVEYIYRLTEGWVAGLQLSTLSSVTWENPEKGNQTHSRIFNNISDYLLEEVLASQPEKVHSFLMQTSILNRLTGPLCNALTGQADGEEMLYSLEKENLFLFPLDEERHWYRYHSIFAKFLRSRLENKEHKHFTELHKAACNWFMGVGELNEAAEHALLAGDVEYAAEQMARCAMDFVRTGQAATVAEWGERLPAYVLNLHPELHSPMPTR